MQTAGKTYRCGTLTYTTRGLVALFAWMLWGDVCFTLMEAVVPSILPLKLHGLESSNKMIGFIMTTLPGVFNLSVTPIISFTSDRHRGRLGRRIPFILYTVPFLTLTLVLIAYDDAIGAWVKRTFLSGNAVSEAQVVIILLAVFAALFDFFNMFVNTIYWYLFNDVVPEEWMGRFMSWFKLVGILTGALYNFFIFGHAKTHMREIYLGAAVLYFVGFGLVLLRTREGEYPPPPAGAARESLLDKFRTYARECYTMRFYWDIYLSFAAYAMAGCVGVFNVFFLQSLGLELDFIGKMGAIAGITIPACLLFTGTFVDKWNAVRVSAYWSAFGAFSVLGNWVWLFVDKPSPNVYFWIGAINGGVFASLFAAINSMLELPRLMELYPKERFGQFCGAIALLRAPAVMIGGVLAGAFMDAMSHIFPQARHGDFYYRFSFCWTAPLTVLGFYFHYRVFRAWKRLGGEKSYVAPDRPFDLRDLPPNSDVNCQVSKGLVSIVTFCWVGSVLGGLAWWAYYTFFELNARYAMIFLVGVVLSAVLFAAYLRFLKFMERP